MRAWMLGLVMLVGSCGERPPADLDGEPAVCAEQPSPALDGGTAGSWVCSGPVALGLDTDDRDWLAGCFSEEAYAYRAGGRIVVVDPEPGTYDDQIEACYEAASSNPVCLATAGASCDATANPCDAPFVPRCLYVRDAPPL